MKTVRDKLRELDDRIQLSEGEDIEATLVELLGSLSTQSGSGRVTRSGDTVFSPVDNFEGDDVTDEESALKRRLARLRKAKLNPVLMDRENIRASMESCRNLRAGDKRAWYCWRKVLRAIVGT